MSTRHVRHASDFGTVIVLTDFAHRRNQNNGRPCPICGDVWTVEVDDVEDIHAFRNGESDDDAILDWIGNNVAVECCRG